MNRLWTLCKRWGAPLVMRIGLAMPVLLGLGVSLLLIAIWWLGPQWTWRGQQPLDSLSSRGMASLLLVLLPVLSWAFMLRVKFRRLQAQQCDEAAAEADPCLAYVQAQERALNQGLAHYLENAGGRRALYRLPWYLVIGEQGAGKSSFIDRSNQRFSLTRITKVQAQGLHIQDLEYPVSWWISDEAVILDPPGELIAQSSTSERFDDKEAEAQAAVPLGTPARLWEHLLGWLACNRSRRALNGLLLVIDLSSLLRGGPEQRTALARTLRTRLHEVSSHLGSRLPLYVVLSKFDLLDGFDELYSRLSAAEREQTLGFTFKLDAVSRFDAWLDEFIEHYDELVCQVQQQVAQTLHSVGCPTQRERLTSLHAQLAGLRPVLVGLLREILASDRFTTPALVRGVYCSSVMQQGEISNAFVRRAAQPYKTTPPLRESKSQKNPQVYFIQQLFQGVIYKEAGLAGDNVRVARSKRQLLWVGSGVGVLAFAIAIASWHRYFDINAAKADGVLAKTQAFGSQEVDQRLDPTGRNLLAPLNQIRDAVSVFGAYRSAWPGVADLGLYQGRAIGPRVDEAYLKLLSRRFLPAIASGVVDAMNAAPLGSDQQMAALRVYRMIEDRDNRRPEWVEDWMSLQWQQAFPGQGAVQRDLMRHLQYALAYAETDLPQFSQRVSEVQQALRKVPLPQRVYASLKQEAQDELHAGLDLRNQIGPAFDVVYQSASVPGGSQGTVVLAPLVTAKGFKEYFEPRSQHITEMAMIDQWALGERRQLDYSSADRKALTESIRNLYTSDYIDTWRRSLAAFAVTDFHDLNHGVSVLHQLTGPAAPLLRLLETVRDNTELQPLPTAEGKQEQQYGLDIRRAFSGMHALLEPKGTQPSYYDETLGAVTAVYDYAKAVQDSSDRGKAALHVVLQRFSMTGSDPIANLQRVASGLPEPLDQQVRKLAEQTARVLNVEALRELERRWDADVYSFFQQRLAGRYPFVAHAPDASLDDFEAFFGPKGRLRQFQDRYLEVFLEENLEALGSQQGGSLIRGDVLKQLSVAERIRETFFDQRGNLSVQFSIEPLGLSGNQRTSLLDLDGQLVSYTHGPRQITGIIWPNTLGPQVRSNLTLLRQNGNSNRLEYRGPWSMFRLLSRGALNGRTATSVDLSFKAGDGVMRYRLNAEKAFNPITQQPFKGFKLPRGLLQERSAQAL
ncbi:type VI secretion system membrane subunit TssM [Pseudomonas putida]|uniref:Type VI secretion system membrane subunit TssM n=1 Tax=Pseudomonas putida TaxID=303 RepID=A0A4D6X785_PSEPU|nr:type VI secretion system membrane subunit TssM [Pseudomonas putida]QCI11874.1 type VI secretion system membrane subunit TssM [Pseudomonas putida]